MWIFERMDGSFVDTISCGIFLRDAQLAALKWAKEHDQALRVSDRWSQFVVIPSTMKNVVHMPRIEKRRKPTRNEHPAQVVRIKP